MSIGHIVVYSLGALLLAGIVVTVALVARGRPPQAPRSAASRARFTPRSMRGFNNMMLRDVRRGAQSSRRKGRTRPPPPRRRSG